MKKIGITVTVIAGAIFLSAGGARAHFGAIIPSDDIVGQADGKTITLKVMFFHPMQGEYMNMGKPVRFGVMRGGEKTDLLGTLKEKKVENSSTWQADYQITRPGDHTFYVEPRPYWEPAEDCHIIHYTKVCVDALGLEEGWEDEVGLETEIVPLTRPYGFWTNNLFTGMVKVNGRPVPFAEVEVEYYNQDGKIKPPAGPYVTQVVRADGNGVFSYAMPKAGWWGFAALNQASRKLKDPEGKEKPIEIGAVYWVRVRDME